MADNSTELFRESADLGLATAQYVYAGKQNDAQMKLRYFRLAAEMEHHTSYVYVAELINDGDHAAKTEALALYEKAIEFDNVHARPRRCMFFIDV